MDNVPQMISTKDLDFIKDMLNWNLTACKKANHYLQHIKDEDVSNTITCAMKIHVDHFNFLLDLLR